MAYVLNAMVSSSGVMMVELKKLELFQKVPGIRVEMQRILFIANWVSGLLSWT